VQIYNSEGESPAPATTSASGFFEFRGLSRATYEISVSVQGYDTAQESVDLNFTSEKGVAIYLKPTDKKKMEKKGNVSAHELSMPPKAQELMESGKKKLYQQKDSTGALTDFEQAVALAPDYYEAYCQMGLASLSIGKRSDAETDFRKSQEISGDKYADADINLGTMQLDKGDNPGGEKLIRRGIELNPTSFLAYYELGRAELNEKKLPEAEGAAQQAKSLAPNSPLVYRLLSIVHIEQKNYAALMQDLDAYLKLDPDSPAAARAKQLRDKYSPLAAEKPAEPPTTKP
jgi:tetratricopeptide (TPR) repeat protein